MASEAAAAPPPEADLPQDQDGRLDVPGVIDERLVLGSVEHAHDEQLLRHLHVSFVLDVENPRKRSASSPPLDAAIAGGRVELDDDYSFESFKAAVTKATEMIRTARGEDRTVFVFCTHGNNEGAVVCITYLMIAESWTLERAYKHVLQKRPASAPRHVYIEKLRLLEKEVHGKVTLRSGQVGPSMIDLMHGLRGVPRTEDADETASQTTETESVTESNIERASFMSTYSVTTAVHNGSSIRETMMIAERDEENEAATPAEPVAGGSSGRGTRTTKANKKECSIM